ncbi:MAG: LacI family transcriptional regulator [Desulfofustis sp.]|nr:LacI family transcriptional regulator [Desulfofustis sp.]
MSKIHDVAKRANVSIATVSRVVNPGRHKVNPETAEKVRAAVKELNYRPNALARALQMKKSMTIGVIIPDISNHYYAEIVGGIQGVADKAGYNIILQNTDRDPDQIVKSIYLLREKIVDGIIFSGGTINGYEPLSALKELRDRVVVIGRHDVDFPAIMVDNIAGATLAVEHLIELGHSRIGLIGWSENSTTAKDRLSGYKNALAQNSYPYDQSLICQGSLTPESGYNQAKILLSRENRPSAIFAGNDQMAFGAVYAAIEMGLRVPEDLAVIGFDNIPLSSFFVPPLSTIAVPMSELGSDSMETLMGLIAGEQVARIKLHKTKLIVRKSTLSK